MNTDTPFIAKCLDDPSWLLHQIDPSGGKALFLGVDREVYRQSLFLDNRIAARQPAQQVVELEPLLDAAARQPARGSHALLHVSHCGSTLLSRLLEAVCSLLALREPIPFRSLAMMQRDLGHPLSFLDPAGFPLMRDGLLALLERRFDGGEPVLIKGTSDCGNLGQILLNRHADNRLILVALKLEPFLATVLRSNLRREETLALAPSRLGDLHRLTGDDSLRLYQLEPGQLAAMSWLSAMAHFVRLMDSEDSARCRLVDFEGFLDQPENELMACARHLGESPGQAELSAALEGPLMKGYSKDPSLSYGPEKRQVELDQCRQRHAAEIRDGIDWVQGQIQQYPSLALLASWLGD